jgi:tRNA nucleotidyltransferase (CCA-adding enzyme)
METYLVGGAVRDKLMGLPVKDRDWVVVGATVEEMLALNYKQVGKDFPVFLHPETKEEYALARTERKVAPGHTGFEICSDPTVTLLEDLERRDLTINAIAETPDGEIIDPLGGRNDLHDRILRHVSDAFTEDPLRVLRVARFASRFQRMGFIVAERTKRYMRYITASGELDTLVPERIWKELDLSLKTYGPFRFLEVLRDCDALKIILPEVDKLFGVPQPEQHHPEIDTGKHIILSMKEARKLTDDPAVLYATLVHDVGKGLTPEEEWPRHIGHEKRGLDALKDIERRLPVPKDYARLARLVCEHHTKLHRVQELRPQTLLKLLESLDAFRRPDTVDRFLLACEADARGRTGLEQREYPQGAYLKAVHEAVLAIDNGAVLADAGDASPQAAIASKRLEVIKQTIATLQQETHDQ